MTSVSLMASVNLHLIVKARFTFRGGSQGMAGKIFPERHIDRKLAKSIFLVKKKEFSRGCFIQISVYWNMNTHFQMASSMASIVMRKYEQNWVRNDSQIDLGRRLWKIFGKFTFILINWSHIQNFSSWFFWRDAIYLPRGRMLW